jgi:hypothetical protein
MNRDASSSLNRTPEQRLLHLLQTVRDTNDTSTRAELNSLLRGSAPARLIMARLLVDEQALISGLRDDGISALLEPASPGENPLRNSLGAFAWRPLAAAAAGLVIGLLSASMVLGFGVVRSLERVVMLIQESFESGPAPLVTGMPQQVNLWSGDYSEIVDTGGEVAPVHGTKMIRLLRSDFEGKTSAKPSRQGDLMRIVDVQPFLRESNGGEVVVTLSALFNAVPFTNAGRHDAAVTVWALGPQFPTDENLMTDALAHSVGLCRPLDDDPATWQRTSTRLLLPPGTERVLLKVSVSPLPVGGANRPAPAYETFAGHFVDDVRASVSMRKVSADLKDESQPRRTP